MNAPMDAQMAHKCTNASAHTPSLVIGTCAIVHVRSISEVVSMTATLREGDMS
jgi:hypothetical protein